MDIPQNKPTNYKFAVQASNPRSLAICDHNDESLSDAIQTIFPLEAEYALIAWNWIYIPLSYKYDVSMMAEDLVELIELMLSHERGNRTIQWPSNTFAATWKVEWGNKMTMVNTEWSCVLGETEAALSARPTILLGTDDFIAEWRRLLQVVAAALEAAGYTPERLVGMRHLQELLGKLGCDGILYRD
jgi:hypothetical protein